MAQLPVVVALSAAAPAAMIGMLRPSIAGVYESAD
ncbi:hypothetical protein QFZ76_009329 [Streptomyces sp. V4I2]|nr:hypothetical protein [Streptomyces sp. V4I2]